MTLLHFCLNVADADTAATWYEDNLGFTYSWEFERDGTRNVYVTDETGVELQLSDTEGEDEFEPGTAIDHVAIGVDDVDEAVATVDHHGIVREPADYPVAGTRAAFVRDPDGHRIELIEPLEG